MDRYTPSDFDLAFRKVAEYLIKQGLTTPSELSEKISLLRTTYSDIMAGRRGVPIHKVDLIKYVLTSQFGVEPNYLNSGKGKYLVTPLDIDESAHPQYAQLKKRIAELEKENKMLIELKATQAVLIASLQNEIKNKSKK